MDGGTPTSTFSTTVDGGSPTPDSHAITIDGGLPGSGYEPDIDLPTRLAVKAKPAVLQGRAVTAAATVKAKPAALRARTITAGLAVDG